MGAADAAALILSVVLHDCATHFSEDGFLRVIDRNSLWPPAPMASQPKLLKVCDDRPWMQLWEEFRGEESRWDDQKLIAMFGDESKSFRPLPSEPSELWVTEHRLLIGEFMRRHHPCLAHEIAVYGVPGPEEDRLRLTGIEPWMADLTGLIARSHGDDLRRVLDRFDDIKDRHSKGGGVHVTQLMCLLRIADYLDIDARRAPEQLFKIRRLRSSILQEEWDKQARVRLVKPDPYDEESLRIEADPQKAAVFAGLQDLFAGIQREIDLSWAVLGEVYARTDFPAGLKIRRIRSTLDNPKGLTDLPFVPVRARFESAGARLLTLMVRPLYSDEPAYGIRELIQNALDACREMEDLLGQRPELGQARARLEADVVSVVEGRDGEG